MCYYWGVEGPDIICEDALLEGWTAWKEPAGFYFWNGELLLPEVEVGVDTLLPIPITEEGPEVIGTD